MSFKSVMSSNHLILCHPLLLPPSIFPASGSFQMSQLFTSGGESIGVSASASVLAMNIQDWFPLIDWLDLLEFQGTLKSLLQHHSSKASILWHSAFFIVQLSHPYMTTGKTIALTRRTFLGPPPLLYSLQTPILMQSSWATYYIARSFAIQLCVGGWSRLFPKQRKILP